MGQPQSVAWPASIDKAFEDAGIPLSADVSFSKDSTVCKKVIRRGLNKKLPNEAARVRISVLDATDGSEKLPGFVGPVEFDFLLGDGEVCDVLELAVPYMTEGECAEVSSTMPRWCEEERLGLGEIHADKVVYTVEVLNVELTKELEIMAEDEIMDFITAREAVGKRLQKAGQLAIGAQRHRAVINMIARAVPLIQSKKHTESGKMAGKMAAARINEQACIAYWKKKRMAPGGGRRQKPGLTTIHVCTGVNCREAGSKAVLAEIEELADMVGGCIVESSCCLSRCSASPTASVVTTDKAGKETEKSFERIRAPQRSAQVVYEATGEMPSLEDSDLLQRFQQARLVSTALELPATGKWNQALEPLHRAEEVAKDGDLVDVVVALTQVLENVGLFQPALDRNDWLIEGMPGSLNTRFQRSSLFRKLGRTTEAIEVLKDIEKDLNAGGPLVSKRLFTKVKEEIDTCSKQTDVPATKIGGYERWNLESVQPVSQHTAVFEFRCSEEKASLPMAGHLWHRTLLAAVGDNDEGPLPWIERDYTPISTVVEESSGTCKLLIKVYPDGAATQWLRNIPLGKTVLLSPPRVTLLAPTLVPVDMLGRGHTPTGVLLVVGGTGVTPALQVLEIFRSEHAQPIVIILGCRAGDMLALQPLQDHVSSRASPTTIRICVSDAACGSVSFAAAPSPLSYDEAVRAFPNLNFHQGRITQDLLASSVDTLGLEGLRAVVSGPQAMNDSVSDQLLVAGVKRSQLTVMKA